MLVGGWGRQEKSVGEAGEVLGGLGGEACCARGKPGLGGDGDFGSSGGYGLEDFVGCVINGGCDDRGSGGEGEPAFFFSELTGVVGVDFAAGAHEAGAHGGDTNAFVAEFGVEALREAYEGELAGDVGQKMRHGEFAADAGDVDDGSGMATEHVGQYRLCGMDGGEEVGGHGSAVGGDGLVFDGADLDDAGVVDEDVDVAEVGDCVFDEAGGLGGVGEVGGDDEDVVGRADGAAAEEGVAGGGELVVVAGSEDELGSGAAVSLGKGEAKAAGAAGDEDDLLACASIETGTESVGCRCRGDAGEELGGVKCGFGFLHNC